jgi:hypothetical protein
MAMGGAPPSRWGLFLLPEYSVAPRTRSFNGKIRPRTPPMPKGGLFYIRDGEISRQKCQKNHRALPQIAPRNAAGKNIVNFFILLLRNLSIYGIILVQWKEAPRGISPDGTVS